MLKTFYICFIGFVLFLVILLSSYFDSSGDSVFPIHSSYSISSYYGYRTLGSSHFHNGIDIPAVVDTPVYPVSSGVISYIGIDDTVFRADGFWWTGGLLAVLRYYGRGDVGGVFRADTRQCGSGGGDILCGVFGTFRGLRILGDAGVEILLVLYIYYNRCYNIFSNAFRKEKGQARC